MTTHNQATWESILEEMRLDPEMSQADWLLLQRAFETLSKHLGKNFPSQVESRKHSLGFPLVYNKAAFAKKQLLWLADAVGLLAEHKNFEVIRGKLRSTTEFRECMDLLRFSCKLARRKWSLEFEPRMNSRKLPDLLCTSPAGRELIVEVSSLGESEVATVW